jgi:hypothetical protein
MGPVGGFLNCDETVVSITLGVEVESGNVGCIVSVVAHGRLIISQVIVLLGSDRRHAFNALPNRTTVSGEMEA